MGQALPLPGAPRERERQLARTAQWLTWSDEPVYPELPLTGTRCWLEKHSLLCHRKQVRSTSPCDARPLFPSAQRLPTPGRNDGQGRVSAEGTGARADGPTAGRRATPVAGTAHSLGG